MKTKHIARELEEIFNKTFAEGMFPYVKGNSIRISHIVVRKNSFGYLIYDTKTNSQIGKTFSKAAALALAKTLAQGKDFRERILSLDHNFEKSCNDAVFHRNIIQKSKDEFRIEVAEIRYDIAQTKAKQVRSKLENFIYI